MVEHGYLTFDENKAAEAAFEGLPLDPRWSPSACAVYEGMREALLKRSLSSSEYLRRVQEEQTASLTLA